MAAKWVSVINIVAFLGLAAFCCAYGLPPRRIMSGEVDDEHDVRILGAMGGQMPGGGGREFGGGSGSGSGSGGTWGSGSGNGNGGGRLGSGWGTGSGSGSGGNGGGGSQGGRGTEGGGEGGSGGWGSFVPPFHCVPSTCPSCPPFHLYMHLPANYTATAQPLNSTETT